MQPQDAQMMGQVAPAGAMGQQVIIVQNKSGGPESLRYSCAYLSWMD
jgi:hypothetical protein